MSLRLIAAAVVDAALEATVATPAVSSKPSTVTSTNASLG
jgi:hypothetical protein